MILYRTRVLLSFVFVFISSIVLSQDIGFSPSALVFSQPVYTTKSDSGSIAVKNNSCGYIKINYSYCPNSEFKLNDTTSFWLAPSATKNLQIKFFPRQNIEYNSAVILHSSNGDFSFAVKGYGKFVETYYDSTYNKFDESLKTSLNTILAANYQSYSYNAVRDKFFMEVDNKKINGQGATQNTLECIYTGRLAVGYANRTDCQTNDNFNTEHTWPQSLFSSNLPMVSDMNHLFPTDDVANNIRANNPFGIVSNPTWSVGGSKGNSSMFEPRDAQKGRTARAMLYFAIRYNNPAYGLNSFFGPQESILRTWCLQFLPDTIDRKRNDDVFAYQKNRNPFIDHPEFLERITSIANTSIAPVKMLVWCDTQGVSKNYFVYDSVNYKIIIYNTGNTDIVCSKIQTTQNIFSLSYPTTTIAKQTSFEISIRKTLLNNITLNDTLVIENNSTNHAVIKIPISMNVTPLRITATKTNIQFVNDSAILSLNTTGVVSWNTTSTGNTLIVKNAGSYFATLTDSSGCHRTDTVTITKTGSGINSEAMTSFSIYPNPANESIYLHNSGNAEENYSLINSLGEIIEVRKAGSNETISFDVSHFSKGIYYLQNDLGEGKKIILNR